MTSKFTRFFYEENRVPGKGSLFAGLSISIILLYVVNNLRYMGITQFNEPALISCMWSLNIVFGLAIVGNFFLILYRPAWFFYLVQTLINAAGVNAFFFIYKLYPFNLEGALLNNLVRIILILIMVVFFIMFLLSFYRCGLNFPLPKKKTIATQDSPIAGENTATLETSSGENSLSAGSDSNDIVQTAETGTSGTSSSDSPPSNQAVSSVDQTEKTDSPPHTSP